MREEEGRIGRIAERTNVSVRTVDRMLLKYDLDKNDFKEGGIKREKKNIEEPAWNFPRISFCEPQYFLSKNDKVKKNSA